MKIKNPKTMHIVAILLFVVMIVMNYLSATGIFLPNTQSAISDKYLNLLAPAGFTFSIWGVIYLGMLLSLIFPLFKWGTESLRNLFYNKALPYYLAWMLCNIVWTITWAYDLIYLSLIAIVFYSVVLVKLGQQLQANRRTSFENPWLLLFPVGLHTGWLLFASYANIMAVLVKLGVDGVSQTGAVLAIVLMILACATVLGVFKLLDNAFITVSALWALFGIFMKQRSGSDFAQSNQTVAIVAIVLFVAALALHYVILKKHRETRKLAQ